MATPVGAVQGQNAHKGVKRSVLGTPVGVPRQLPGFRGRSVGPAAPVKVPKLRNGNLNNPTSNVRIPYNRVCPLEMLTSYQGRVGPGDVLFNYKYPPGFTKAQAAANNATLGVNTLSRVVGLDGLNRILMGSGPNGWRVGENVYHDPVDVGPYGVLAGTDGAFALSALNDYRLDGVVISNDEPGAFTSSGSRDNAIFNIAIQGPVETNNGFLMYEDPAKSKTSLFNPLTGATNMRTVEAHARGSAESGMHIENTPMPGQIGSEFQRSRGKVDFVANYCGTYSMYPSQMFDRRIESMNTLYVGLRAYELSLDAKKRVTTATGEKFFKDKSDAFIEQEKMYFYQYLPFSSRVAHVIQEVTDVHFRMTKEALTVQSGGAVPTDAQVRARMRSGLGAKEGRAKAAKMVKAIKQQTSTSLPSAQFDTATYDPVRSEDLWHMIGAWQLGRVLDTKAAVHERYAGGPRDTAFSCIVDVNVCWRAAVGVQVNPDTKAPSTGFLVDPSEKTERGGQQSATTLANNLFPPLRKVIGSDFGRDVRPPTEDAPSGGGGNSDGAVVSPTEQAARAAAAQLQQQQAQALEDEDKRLAALAGVYGEVPAADFRGYKDEAALLVRQALSAEPQALELLADDQFGTNPMEKMRTIIGPVGDGQDQIDRISLDAWTKFTSQKQSLIGGMQAGATKSLVDAQRAKLKEYLNEWQELAKKEVAQILKSVVRIGVPADTVENISAYEAALLKAKGVIEAKRDAEVDPAKKLAYERELGRLLNRTNHFLNLFMVALKELGARGNGLFGSGLFGSDFDNGNVEESTDRSIADAQLFRRVIHFSAMCDLHAKHVLLEDPRLDAPLSASPAPALAAAPAPAPPRERGPLATAAATTGASAAGASTGPRPAAKSKGRSPARSRPSATGAAPPASSAAVASPAPAVPAGAANMSSVPLVPTQAGAAEPAAPRRRAREAAGGSESVTNSLFENMFKPGAATDATAEEPASPTPSSGSEGPSGGPRTFRRQR